MSEFVGIGEERTVEILGQLFPKHDIYTQVHISTLISSDNMKRLGTEHCKHKHDIVMEDWQGKYTVIEVNYKHGSIAEEKWLVYKAYLEDAGHKTCTIDDNECVSLFSLKNPKDPKSHVPTWQDWIDVIKALDKAGVKENA